MGGITAGIPAAQLSLECPQLVASSLCVSHDLGQRVTQGNYLVILDGHPSIRKQHVKPFLVPDEEVEFTIQIRHTIENLLQR